MKIKLTKEELQKLISEAVENEINKEVEESLDDTDNTDEPTGSPLTKGTIPFDDLLKPGRFFNKSKM